MMILVILLPENSADFVSLIHKRILSGGDLQEFDEKLGQGSR